MLHLPFSLMHAKETASSSELHEAAAGKYLLLEHCIQSCAFIEAHVTGGVCLANSYFGRLPCTGYSTICGIDKSRGLRDEKVKYERPAKLLSFDHLAGCRQSL
ncbi:MULTISPECIES: hypothetical protein [unclassified Paenibacillus]|uniref:hypothetical protein n=1 Tax=unclassified Paenibacillus TaxID=185978 RepID=UPI001AEB0D71|nr:MULTISPECIES: hypothetical protein [unclassified Paenibacillus]MBP1153809.1 hypothetical protein [Paenibacillus sp. PvP091]MBP1170806.1 hypothetical protein [Paenibacillus sp. PvR098]MBP2441834.1 hypothetical protein [Paenibacillus sp. PvP052]